MRSRGTNPALVLTVMCAGMFLVLLDVTVVNVAVPSIATGLGATTAGVQWVVDGYTVTLASLLLGGGALGDRFGHRRTVAVGLAVFGAASAGCALAPSAAVLVAARAAQGVGAALLLPGSIAAITRAYPDRPSQARALGIWAGVSSLALPAGPLLGGVLVGTWGWPAAFWINPPAAALCLVGVFVWVRAAPRRSMRRLDLSGLVLSTVALAAAVYAVIAVGTSVAAAVAASAVAVAALASFLAAERRAAGRDGVGRDAAEPLLPLGLFRRPAFGVANGSALAMNLTSNGLLFLLTRYLQSVLGHSAAATGLLLLPLFAPVAALAPLAGRLTARHGPGPVMLTGALVAAAGQLALLLVSPATAYARLLPAMVGVGLGIGLFTAPVVAAAVRAVPADRAGLASGVNNASRQTGTAFGVAVYGALAADPAHVQHFVDALRHLGIAAAVLWLAVAAVSGKAGVGAWSR